MRKLNLACADFTFPLLTHDRVLDLIAMLDFKAVDNVSETILYRDFFR